MLIRIIAAVAILFACSASAERDDSLASNSYLLEAVRNAATACAKYAVQKLGEAIPNHAKIVGEEPKERHDAWRNITYDRNFEACIAKVAGEMANSPNFDQDKGKDKLKQLDPLYAIDKPAGKADATITSVSPGKIRYGAEVMSLGEFLDVVWSKQLRNIVYENPSGSDGNIFCVLHFGYISGARISIRNPDGSWMKTILNAGTGEKGTALTVNQCLSGNAVSD